MKSGLFASISIDGKKLHYPTQEDGKRKTLHVLDIASGKDDIVVDLNDGQFGNLDLLGWKSSPVGDKLYIHVGFVSGYWYEYDVVAKKVIDDDTGTFKELVTYDPQKNNVPDWCYSERDPHGDGPAWGLDGKMYNSSLEAKRADVEMTLDSWRVRELYLREPNQESTVSDGGRNYSLFVTKSQPHRAYIIDRSTDTLVGVIPEMASLFYEGHVFFAYENENLVLRKCDVAGNDEKDLHLKVIGINLGKMKLAGFSSVSDYKNLPYMLVQTYDDQFFYWILVDKKKLQQMFSVGNNPAPPAEGGAAPPASDAPAPPSDTGNP